MKFLPQAFLLIVIVFLKHNVNVNAAPTDDEFDLVILHNNDMHARFEQTNVNGDRCTNTSAKCYGGFARVAHLVRKYREEEKTGTNVLYLNAGDTYTGTTWFNVYKANITSAFMNELRPDAISLGNHEFDEGVAGLIPFLNSAEFPVLATNLNLKHVPEIEKTKSFKKSVVLEKRGRKIGIIGYLTPDTKFLAPPNDVEYFDEITSINKEADLLKSQGVNIIIALGHSGFSADKRIAAECPDVDIVIGGHSNTFLYNGNSPDIEIPIDGYPTVIQSGSKKAVPVVQAYAYTKYLGAIKLKFNKNGDLFEWNGKPILLDATVPQADDVLQLLDVYRPKIIELQKTIVGRTKVFLDGACRLKECNMGNLMADAMLWKYTNLHQMVNGFWTDAPLAVIQGGGIRGSINPADSSNQISMAQLSEVFPWLVSLATVELTGTELKAAFENSVANYKLTDPSGAFLQISGARVKYNLSNEKNNRVMELEILCDECAVPKYEPLVETKTYKVVTNSFLSEGGDNYFMFLNAIEKETFDAKDVDLLSEYIGAHDPIYPAVDGRITIYGEPDDDDDTTPSDEDTTTTQNDTTVNDEDTTVNDEDTTRNADDDDDGASTLVVSTTLLILSVVYSLSYHS